MLSVIGTPFLALWYWLTALYPRRMPTTEAAYDRFKLILVQYFGVPNEPQVWVTVAGQITSAHAQSRRLAWGKIANAAKRLTINKIAQISTNAARKELDAKLHAKVK